MSNEEIKLMFSYWCKYAMTYNGKYEAANLRSIESSADEILKKFNYHPLCYDLMNAAVNEMERSVQQ